MIISMQGNWKVSVKSKSAAFAQRFIVSGAISGNGVHAGTPGTSVTVTGTQWTIAIQNNPGTGFQLSNTMLKFPQKVGSNYQFDIHSDDAAGDEDFNDLILTCSTPASLNTFVIYGNVKLYSGRCIFNPCRRFPYIIETLEGLRNALKNPRLREVITRLYPERIPPHGPPQPDPPPYFKPIVLDLSGEMAQPKTAQIYRRIQTADAKGKAAAKADNDHGDDLIASNFELVQTTQLGGTARANLASSLASKYLDDKLVSIIDDLYFRCHSEPASNITLSFEEYDRTAAELAGGAYTGTGPRRLLGDAITDANGNYIFRFHFRTTFPFREDVGDIAPGESTSVVLLPDVIVKVLGAWPLEVQYESAPHNNIPHLKRIDLCLPRSTVHVTSACFNGNLIGGLGNVSLGGNQNSHAYTTAAALQRYGNGNHLEAEGTISVGSPLALFSVECAAWGGVIDMRGCMYDMAKPKAANNIEWYTIRVQRAGSSRWEYVSQNYKHPRYSHRSLPNYTGDDVGPFLTPLLVVVGNPPEQVPAYKNIQREIQNLIDWETTNSDRFMQLDTRLYDILAGKTTPGTFYVRVDGYDGAGNQVATDMIALFIHNLPLDFQLVGPSFAPTSGIVDSGCGLYRLTNTQMNEEMHLAFQATDPFLSPMAGDSRGFVHSYDLTMSRCPGPMLALQVNEPASLPDTASSATTLAHGDAAGSTHNTCVGYDGTHEDFSTAGLVDIRIQPAASEGGWIKPTEYFTVLSFGLSAYKRVTNGYNSGVSGPYLGSASIYLERLTP